MEWGGGVQQSRQKRVAFKANCYRPLKMARNLKIQVDLFHKYIETATVICISAVYDSNAGKSENRKEEENKNAGHTTTTETVFPAFQSE